MCKIKCLFFFFTFNGVPCDNYGEKSHTLKDAIIHNEILPTQLDDSDEEGETPLDLDLFFTNLYNNIFLELSSSPSSKLIRKSYIDIFRKPINNMMAFQLSQMLLIASN